MKITRTDLPGVVLIEPRAFRDARGYFMETWNQSRYQELGLPDTMVQDNLSWSRRGVLRGLHFQFPACQGKLIYVLSGLIFDVVADVRVGSPSFGQWVGVELSLENRRQLYIPEGFAHGFCVLSAKALVAYKCSETYRPECEVGVAWNDPRIGVRWPLSSPIMSTKDAALRRLDDLPADFLPRYADYPDSKRSAVPCANAA
jgi:dTDP-4-dehydrorhamnose 3,5-epimerase